MSMNLQRLVWGIRPGFLTSTEKLILMRLVCCSEGEQGPSLCLRKLSAETQCSLKTLQKLIGSLLNKNLIEIAQPFRSNNPNIYRVNVEALMAVQKGDF